MARMMIVVIALTLPMLAGCAGMYVAGDVGAHGDGASTTPADSRPTNDTSR